MPQTPHIGTWAGPGILVLDGGKWRHVDPDDLTPAERFDIRYAKRIVIGQDHPLIAIANVDEPLRDTVAP